MRLKPAALFGIPALCLFSVYPSCKVFREYLAPDPPPGTSMDPRLLNVTVRRLLEHAGGWDRDVNRSRR
jgi:hypothetical protein